MAKRVILLALVGAGLGLAGIVNVDDPIPSPGVAGAPHTPLSAGEQARFLRGRLLFDKDFLATDGGGPVFNGDSCRSCHLDPVIGGAGGIDVQVQRPEMETGGPPAETGDLAQTHAMPGVDREEIPESGVLFVEERNSPSILGLGLVETISDATILQRTAPTDANHFEGMAHMLAGNVVGRFGWKAQVPDLESFVRDAMGNELGVTVPDTGSAFGFIADGDTVLDPELQQDEQDDIVFFLRSLDFPPRLPSTPQITNGAALFNSVGCALCHAPTLDGVELYSDLLLHDVQQPGFQGVTQGDAVSGFYRTAPLRGLRSTAPYFHDGREETVRDAIERHDGQAAPVIDSFKLLSQADQEALLAFLDSL